MKNVVIWGTGQGGRMLLKLLRANIKVAAFCDNNEKLWGIKVDGIPVIKPKQLPDINPDLIYIAILNKEACILVEKQIEKLGIDCRSISITELRDQFDVRLATLKLLANEIKKRNIVGAVAELGVYKGEFAAEINRIFPDRNLYLFDTFEGFDQRDIEIEKRYSNSKKGMFNDTSLDEVCSLMPYPNKIIIKKGYFPNTAYGLKEKFALVSLDADLYQPMYEGLKIFFPCMSKGGYIILHDYNNSQFCGAGEAVDQFCKENNIYVVPLCDLHGSAVIVKT